MPDPLNAADLIASTSAFGEGFSNALAGGMVVGLPPIATDVGGGRRIVGDTDVIVLPGDPAALADAIGALLAEPAAARRARGGAARRRIEQEFSLAAATSGYARLYRELV